MNSESDTIDAAQMEQEIEKEALEVTSTPAEAEEEDTTLADIEGRNSSSSITCLHIRTFLFFLIQMVTMKMSVRIISN